MNDQMMMQAAMGQAADAGRGTDTVVAHMTLGEVVIPREIMEDPEAAQAIQAVLDAYGVNVREFTVGDPANKINPETGYPEFSLKKKVQKTFKKIAPIALPILGSLVAPGIGTALGSTLGSAALSGVGGAVGGGLGGAVSGGGLKGALTGAALGGAGGYITGGGMVPGLGSIGGATGAGGMGPITPGTGLLGGLGNAAGLGAAAPNAFGTGASTGLGGLAGVVRPAASIFSGVQQSRATDDAERRMLEAQGRATEAMQPYSQMGLQAQGQLMGNLQSGFDPSQLANDPGYQYRVQQGQQALDRSLAASGMSQSGAALKATQELGQGLAAQQYNDAYNQWLAQNQQLAGVGQMGMGAAGSLGNLYQQTGQIQAGAGMDRSNILTGTLADLLGREGLLYGR